jgi:cyclopropane fatty-acyl-phospholipid synthase-like methyltransferase
MSQVTPEAYYDALKALLCELFGHDWHLGYWLNAATIAESAERLNAVMAARLAVEPGMRVLDVGCGVGGSACFIAAATGAQVVGISNSRPGLEEAARFAKAQHVDHLVSFQFGEMQQIPFPDASFDRVWSCEALHNVADKSSVVPELARVLRPGGRVVLGDLFLLNPAIQSAERERLQQFSFHLSTADAFIDRLQASGIRVAESIDIGHHVGPRSPEMSAQICRERLERTAPQTLERTILERTIMATSFLAELFKARTIGWGIWVGVRE